MASPGWSADELEPDLSAGAGQLRQLEAACRRQLSAGGQLTAEQRAQLHNRLGLLLYGQVRFDEAADQYSAALGAWPRLAAAAHNRAIVRYRMGCFLEAEEDLLLALSLDPDNPEIAVGLRETQRLIRKQAASSPQEATG